MSAVQTPGTSEFANMSSVDWQQYGNYQSRFEYQVPDYVAAPQQPVLNQFPEQKGLPQGFTSKVTSKVTQSAQSAIRSAKETLSETSEGKFQNLVKPVVSLVVIGTIATGVYLLRSKGIMGTGRLNEWISSSSTSPEQQAHLRGQPSPQSIKAKLRSKMGGYQGREEQPQYSTQPSWSSEAVGKGPAAPQGPQYQFQYGGGAALPAQPERGLPVAQGRPVQAQPELAPGYPRKEVPSYSPEGLETAGGRFRDKFRRQKK